MSEHAGPVQPPIIEKPWGSEVLFAAVEGCYAGKIITLHGGHAVSLQRHRSKTETIIVISGRLQVELGDQVDGLQRHELEPGTSVHVPALMLHRFTALVDTRFVEVSTADAGWETDVERLEDRYGRTGTSRP